MNQKIQQRNEAVTQVAKLTGIGWVIAIDLVAPILLGWWLDGVFGLNYLIIIGLVFGILLVPISVWQMIKLLY